MGNHGDVYERYYMPNFIDRDTLAIYLSTPQHDDLIRAVGQLKRHEEAPDKLTDAQEDEIWDDPEMVSLLKERREYAATIKENGYPTIKAAKGTEYYTLHTEVQSDINSLKTKLRRKLLNKTINKFHETVHSAKVERQKRGILPSAEVLNPATIKYELKERGAVTRLLFQPFDDMSLEKVSQVRIQLVDALVQLCRRQETPHQFKASRSSKRLREVNNFDKPCKRLKVHDFVIDKEDPSTDITLMDDTIQDTSVELCCPFCKCDVEAGPRKGEHKYSRRDSWKRHIRGQHLTERAIDEGFDCPYEGCTAFLGTATQFLRHAEGQHGDRF
jgi:hypothetical protein